MFLYNKKKNLCFMYMHLKYTLHVVLTSLSHYKFLFIIICYLTPSLVVVHSYHDETIFILILDIEIKQGILNIG